MKLPVFDGIQEALQRYNVQRKRVLDERKTEKHKERRVQLKIARTKEGQHRKDWSSKHGQDMYGNEEDDLDCDVEVAAKGSKEKKPRKRTCKACGSSIRQHSNH